MKAWFIDANVFLRFFAVDDVRQYEQAARILRQAAEGELRLVCGPPVLFEIAWTLRVAHKLSKDSVLEVLQSIFAWPGIDWIDRDVVRAALVLAQQSGVEFADSYIAASARAAECDGVATFNLKDFKRLGLRMADF